MHKRLKRRPGLRTWKVFDDNMDVHETFSSLSESSLPSSVKNIFRPTMWPSECDDDLPLERCMRLYPQDQNTGGFFVAVLRKVKPLPNSSFSPSSDKVDATTSGNGGSKHEFLNYKPARDSFTLSTLQKSFHLKDSFLAQFANRLLVRTTTKAGILTLVDKQLFDHIEENKLSSRRLRPVYSGMKLCEADGRRGNIRITRAGAELMLRHCTTGVVTVSRRSARMLLHNVNHFMRCSMLDKFDTKGLQTGPCIVCVALEETSGESNDANENSSKRAKTQQPSQLVFPGQFDKEQEKLKLYIQFSKGLEGLPRATAKVYLNKLRDPLNQ
eukprot:m.148478 g.148478  ORF g.148478 m.148478 type:complete len:327 (+) comp13258_c0_seq11:1128-2108(+)